VNPHSDLHGRRQQILAEMASIELMESGTLSSFQPAGSHRGPYFRLQHWQDDRNLTTYVPQRQVARVTEAVANAERFRALSEEYIAITTQLSRQQVDSQESKKNSRRQPARRSTRSPSSAPSPRRG
jgi:hypothetical protein